jgi:hypothetical protein
MSLKEKLEKLKKAEDQMSADDWEDYKLAWQDAIKDLYNNIMYRWLNEYAEDKLIEFSEVPVIRVDPYIGEYLTAILEITLTNNKFIVLEPISGVTADYDGKLEFYMRGNINEKVNILRKIVSGTKYEWIVGQSVNIKEHYKLDKTQLENIIEKWLQ